MYNNFRKSLPPLINYLHGKLHPNVQMVYDVSAILDEIVRGSYYNARQMVTDLHHVMALANHFISVDITSAKEK